MIYLDGITKSFYVRRRGTGAGAAVKSFLSAKRTEIRALDGVGFEIKDGEAVGYIGPNGAGKSTTIKVMCGILTPDSGSCVINGRVPWKQRVQHVREIGVVFGQRSQLWWDLPVIDSFDLLGSIYKMERPDWQSSMDELTEVFEIADILKTPTRTLSLGQRMRCEIAAALLHRPQTLFLDEPTIGLDAVSKIAVRGYIRKINRERGTTVILTTHDMQDIDALTERVILIGRGKVLLDGSLDALKREHIHIKSIVVTYQGELTLPRGMRLLSQSEGRAELAPEADAPSLSEMLAALSATAVVTDLSVRETTVDDMAVSLYKELNI